MSVYCGFLSGFTINISLSYKPHRFSTWILAMYVTRSILIHNKDLISETDQSVDITVCLWKKFVNILK